MLKDIFQVSLKIIIRAIIPPVYTGLQEIASPNPFNGNDGVQNPQFLFYAKM